MFVDINELPFDDADLFDSHEWEVVEGKYPYPIVFNQTSPDEVSMSAPVPVSFATSLSRACSAPPFALGRK